MLNAAFICVVFRVVSAFILDKMGKIMRGLRNLVGWLSTRRKPDTLVAMHREKAEGEVEVEKNEMVGSDQKVLEEEEKSEDVQVVIEEGNGQNDIAGTVEMDESGDPFEGITFDDLISEDEAEEEVSEGGRGNGGEADIALEWEEMLEEDAESPEMTEKTVTEDGNAEQQAGIDEMEIENEVDPVGLIVEKVNVARESQDEAAKVTVSPFTCQHCHLGFGCKSQLKTHSKVHSGLKAFACSVCDKKFARPGDLKMHLVVHSTDRSFQCQCHICGKRFAHHRYLAAHLKRHLARPRPYECQQCSKRFLCKPDLKHHLVVHTDERPFKCALCNSACRRKYNLKMHLMKFHKKSKQEANQLTNQVNSVDMSSVIQSTVPGEPSTRKDQGTQTENNN